MIGKPALVGVEMRDAIEAAWLDALAGLGVGSPVAAAGVADESRVQDEFAAARGEPAVELVAQADPGEFRAD